MWRDAIRSVPRASLRIKLVAVTLCLLAAGAAVILAVGASALRGQLTRQAGEQLRAYANQLISHRFEVLGTARGAPVATVPFDATGARAPGTASLSGAARAAAAASAPGALATGVAGVAGTGAFSIELRGPSGQLLLSVGPGTRPGQAVPAPFAPVPARTGVLRTVQAAGGGDYLVITEPVHVQARRLVYGYGADDFAITGGARTGPVGTLAVGLQLAGIGQTVRRLALLAVAASAAAILIAGGLAWAAIRFSLRPVIRAAQTADAVTEGDLSSGMQERADDGLAESVTGALAQLEARCSASAEAEQAARSATDQVSRDLAAVAEALRRPVSLLHGTAEHWTHHGRHGTEDADRALDQVATAAARAEAVLDQLDSARCDPAVSRDRG